MSKRFVVDASVARSAGGESATFPSSLDDRVRAMLAVVSDEILALGNIIWINPVNFEGMDSWLLKGAPALKELMIRP